MDAPLALDSAMCHETGLDDAEKRCWHQFFHSSTRLLDTLSNLLVEAHGLTLFDVLMLDLLAKSDSGSARMSDLADAFMLIPSRVTWQIRRLESAGLVQRSRSRGDRRGVHASITPEGRARARSAMTTYAQEIRTHYLDRMSRQQMIALGDGCRRISAPLEVPSGRRD